MTTSNNPSHATTNDVDNSALNQLATAQLDSCYLHENNTTASFTFNLLGSLFHIIFIENLEHPSVFESRLIAAWRVREQANSEDSDSMSAVESAFVSLRQDALEHVRRLAPFSPPLTTHSAFDLVTSAETEVVGLYPTVKFGANSHFLDQLKTPADLALHALHDYLWVPFGYIEISHPLDGSSGLVHLAQYKNNSYCLKALDPVILQSDPDSADAVVNGFYRELAILSSIPPHEHIVPILGIVYLPQTGDIRKIIGFIQPFYTGPTLAETDKHYTIDDKISISFQLVSAVLHLHRVAKTFHGDLKLDNVILTIPESKRIVLIDFEQSRMNADARAPETGGEWDAVIGSDDKLCYIPYTGVERVVGPGGWYGEWSAFHSWTDIREALERAEVWSVGTVMGKIFRLGRADNRMVEGSPHLQKLLLMNSLIYRCHSPDPLARPLLHEILQSLQEVMLPIDE